MHCLFVVEDEDTSFLTIEKALGENYNLVRAKSVREALRILPSIAPDLILLDLMLPDGDGFQILSLLKSDPITVNIPTIFLSARSEVETKVMGLKLGADDYITKPVSPLELRARIENKIMKRDKSIAADTLIFGDLNIDPISQQVSVYEGGKVQVLNLTPIEFKILLSLAQNTNQVFTRDDIIRRVWGSSIHIQPRNVDTHITSLRKKLRKFGSSLESVYGSGYRFNPTAAMRHSA